MKIKYLILIVFILLSLKSIYGDPKKDYDKAVEYYDAKDYSNAAELFLKSSKEGYMKSQEYMGYMYEMGMGVEINYEKAKYWYEEAVKQGSTYAMGNLALLYYNGKGVNQDYKTALELFLKAGKLGDMFAQENLGYMYEKGYGTKQDYNQAKYWYLEAIKQGSTYAMGNLGLFYYYGKGMQKDYKKAFELFIKGGEDSFCQYYLGLMYYYGNGVEQDYKAGFELFYKSGKKGYLQSQEQLGYMYEKGLGTERDYKEAVYWYETAIKQNSSYAMSNLGLLYEKGLGVEQSYEKAINLYEEAIKLGSKYAMGNLGYLYFYGKGITQDYKKAFELFNNSNDDYYSQYFLGLMYINGYGVEKNINKGLEWLKKSEESNNSFALYLIGLIYFDGKGIEKDKKKAFNYFKKSADMGDISSIEYMGYLYEFGEGIEKNYKEAINWYTEGANKGSDYCQYRLALMYYDGKGTNKNLDLAYSWFRKASDQGYKDATNMINEMLDNGYKLASKNNNKATDKEPPIIYIDKNNFSKITESKILLNGRAFDESGVAIVLVNEKEAVLKEDGTFSVSILLKVGENNINIHAIDIYENESKETFNLTRYTKEETEEIYNDEKVDLGNWYVNQYAIIIGINVYENSEIPALKNAENDANSLIDILNKSKYKVTPLIGSKATRKNILDSLKEIKKKMTPNDSFLFYFAGHGQALATGQDKKIGYIIPYDASVNLSTGELIDFEEQAISLDQLKKYINDIPAKHIAIILDSCFSGLAMESRGDLRPVKRSDTKDYYETLLKNKSINLLTAGDDQPVSDGSNHSPFTRALLMALADGNIDIDDNDGFATFSELSMYVKKKVEKITEGKQRPQFDNLTEADGDYIFRIYKMK